MMIHDSPRLILLNMGVSISNAAANWRCRSSCSSLSSHILFPNNISFVFYDTNSVII